MRAGAFVDGITMVNLPTAGSAQRPPWLIAAPDREGNLADGIDLARIDASSLPPFRALEMKRQCDRPAMLEVPGRRTRRGNSLLTDTEFLIMAGAEGFDWITLAEADPHAVDRARRFLPSRTQVAATICSYDHEILLPDLCTVADAIIVDMNTLMRTHDPRQAHAFVLRSVLEAGGRNTRCMVRGRQLVESDETRELSELLEQGVDGLVVDSVLDAPSADRLRHTLDRKSTKPTRTLAQPRATARLGRGRIRMATKATPETL